jgi:hypothetical protein
MATINQLSAVDAVVSSDQIPIYSSNNGDARKASLATVAKYLSTQTSFVDGMITQYAAPSATGFTVNILDGVNSVWLVLTPTTALAAGTIKLPTVTNCVDKQEILINTTQAITTLTINSSGASVTGAPTTLAANAFFKLRFEGVTDTWYRIG